MADAPKQFPPTRWTFVEYAGQPEHPAQAKALADILTQYSPALKAFLIAQFRIDEHQAADLLQSFVLEKVIKAEVLARAERQRGKFRTFLLNTLTHFVISELRRAGAQKRTPTQGAVSLDEMSGAGIEFPVAPLAVPFDAVFARQVIQEAVQRMQAQCAAGARNDIWGVFRGRLLDPIFEQTEPTRYEELVKRFAFQSPGHASNALITAKRMFARVLRAVVAEYVENETEIEAELNELQAILSDPVAAG
jgi:DNA-directed RNA polymerase specialized sigma24 family protein